MSSIPVAGLAKALIVVTVSLHPGAAHHDPGSYTVRPGDTLAAIAARAYANAADWPAVWWANRRQVPDPAMITAGERLQLPGSPQVPPWLARAALAAIAAPPAPPAPSPCLEMPMRSAGRPPAQCGGSPMASTAVTRSYSGPDKSCSATRTTWSSTRRW